MWLPRWQENLIFCPETDGVQANYLLLSFPGTDTTMPEEPDTCWKDWNGPPWKREQASPPFDVKQIESVRCIWSSGRMISFPRMNQDWNVAPWPRGSSYSIGRMSVELYAQPTFFVFMSFTPSPPPLPFWNCFGLVCLSRFFPVTTLLISFPFILVKHNHQYSTSTLSSYTRTGKYSLRYVCV